ncbi:hypothetical protein BC477_07005 [Clavibacter michiganensis subsp. michiganensis]|uniref:Uncharacterized protein n=1 Tax=Clavibacter michiganensis subsp. michiganensis TaxID=33013 RepID=A0A251XM13_CLAMM|nr:hypothetical protein BC477_07005 [Clavibacter michiganensis subsp. michiganensis]OUE04466.1 hypothetical protein CMMCAS07_05935 [Clavibacter michiganensis subsp. michiganensis]
MNGSASGASQRSATCMPSTRTARPVAGMKKLWSNAPSTPSCTRYRAPPLMTEASTTSASSRFLRRRGTWIRGTLGARSRGRAGASAMPALATGGLLQPVDDLLGAASESALMVCSTCWR